MLGSPPTNADRAEWAATALDTFSFETFNGVAWEDLCDEDKRDCLGDLVCNLLHLSAREGYDPADVVRRAVSTFEDERADEAQEENDA